ncbi:MAG: hypothetical protein D6834_01055 [Aquificota bacterium]|nr:MAG: hypothetical protein D6834_01055 [Aquificota bacterium]
MTEGLIIDLDGVITKDKALTPFEDAPKFIKFLKDKKIKFKIATNNTLYSPDELVSKLNENSIAVSLEEVITPLYVAPYYLKEKNIKDIFVIGSENLKSFFNKDFNVKENINVEAVIIGQDKNFNFQKMKIATSAIKENNAEILALNANLITKDDDGLVFPGVGSVAHMFSYATNKSWIHFGKNSEEYNKVLFDYFKDIKNIAVISDDIFTDLIPFSKIGLKAIFITTGKYKEKDIPKEFKPDFIAHSLKEVINFIN